MDELPRKKKQGRSKAKEFLDAAFEAFARHCALEKWRETEDMRETLGFDAPRAVEEACTFLERGPYRHIWRRHWRAVVAPVAATKGWGGDLFAAMEEAVAAAFREEIEERRRGGDRPIEEDPEYKAFLDCAMNQLFREAAGELERPDAGP